MPQPSPFGPQDREATAGASVGTAVRLRVGLGQLAPRDVFEALPRLAGPSNRPVQVPHPAHGPGQRRGRLGL